MRRSGRHAETHAAGVGRRGPVRVSCRGPNRRSRAATPGVSLVIRDGQVTLKADQASVRQILAEWERQGQIEVVGADKLAGAPVTLTLVDLPEKQALEIVMRGVPGYMAIDGRPADAAPAGPSRYDRVVVMARATTPVPAAASGAAAPARHALAGAAGRLPADDAGADAAAFAPPVGDDGALAAGPDRNDVEQFQQGEPPMPDAPVASPYPNAYPGSPYIGAGGNAGPSGGNPAAAAAAGMTAAPPETQFDYANPQRYFEQRRLQQQGQQPTAVPTAVPTLARRWARPAARRRRCRRGFRPRRAPRPAGHRAGTAGGAAAGTGEFFNPYNLPPTGCRRRRCRQRDASRAGPRQVQQPCTSRPQPPGVTPSDVSGEYAERGDYHRAPDAPGTTSRPISPSSLRPRLARALPAGTRVLDAGCGEGVLVEEFAGRLAIEGVDPNYSSAHVQRGSLLELPFPDGRFPRALCLDVLEHLTYEDQPRALAELHRVLVPGGELLVSVPNLAHLQSRVHFLLTGRLIRTASEPKHPGDRPIADTCASSTRRLRRPHRARHLPHRAGAHRVDPPQAGRPRLAAPRADPPLPPVLSFLALVTLRRRLRKSRSSGVTPDDDCRASRAAARESGAATILTRARPPAGARQELRDLRPWRRRHQHRQLPAAAALRALPDAGRLRRDRPADHDRSRRQDRLPLRPRRVVHAVLRTTARRRDRQRLASTLFWFLSVVNGVVLAPASSRRRWSPQPFGVPGYELRAAHPAGQHLRHRLLLHPVPRAAACRSPDARSRR